MKIRNFFDKIDSKEILAKGLSFFLIRFLGLLVGYFFAYLVSKNYGADKYGLVVLCFSFFLFAGIIGRLGIDLNLVRYYSVKENEGDSGLFYRVLLKSIIFSSFLAILIYVFRNFICSTIFGKPQLEPYIIWIVPAIPLWSVVLVCAGFLRGLKNNKWFAFLNNPGRFALTILFFLVFLWLNKAPLDAIRAHFAGVLVLAIIAFTKVVSVFKEISFKNKKNTWKFVSESFPMMLSSTMIILLGWLDTFILGVYAPEESVGVYNVALKIATLTSFSLQAINSILAPNLASSYQKNEMKEFRYLIRFSTKVNFFITLAIVILISVFSQWILSIFGEEFLAGQILVYVLCLGQLMNSFCGSVGVILQMTGHQKTYQYIILFGLILNVTLNFSLIPHYQGLGAAIATMATMAVINVTGAVFIKNKLDIESYYFPFGLKRT